MKYLGRIRLAENIRVTNHFFKKPQLHGPDEYPEWMG